MMDRRGFLGMMVGGVAAAAAVRTFPFRVFSFPSEIKLWEGTRIPRARLTRADIQAVVDSLKFYALPAGGDFHFTIHPKAFEGMFGMTVEQYLAQHG